MTKSRLQVKDIKFALLFVLIWVFQMSVGSAQEPSAEDAFSEAIAQDKGNSASSAELQAIATALDEIVSAHPTSDIAVKILLRDTIGDYNIADFYGRLKTMTVATDWKACLLNQNVGAPDTDLVAHFELDETGVLRGLPALVEPTQPTAATRKVFFALAGAFETCVEDLVAPPNTSLAVSSSPNNEFSIDFVSQETAMQPLPKTELNQSTLQSASKQDEDLLDLDKKSYRDIQSRLLVLGFDPNGVDGVPGKGTRQAIANWQTSKAVEATGQINTGQLAELREQSESLLTAWLQDEDNAKLYDPPPPIPVGPANLSGQWRYTTTCGSNSRVGKTKIRGAMVVRHAGGRNYSGALSNTQGLKANLNATLRGRSITAIANFGWLFGKVTVTARVDDQKLVLRGRDSNRCSFYAYKT